MQVSQIPHSHNKAYSELLQLVLLLCLPLAPCVRLQELHESSFSSFTIKVYYIIGSSLDQLNSGESLNFNFLQFIGGAVRLGDDNTGVVLVFLAQFVPDWDQLPM